MRNPLHTLLDAIDAKPLGDDRFQVRCVEHRRPRVFGGELLAQAVAVAARTVQDRACHAMHVNFLSPGDPKTPIEYSVRRVRDGRRFAQRQVSGYQRGREIVLATVSFTTDSADAAGFQREPMPDVPGPEGLASELDQRLAVADRFAPEHRPWLTTPRAVEVRQVRPVPLFDPPPVPPIAHTWIKAVAAIPDDQALHCAVLAYASDATLLDIAFYPHGVSWISPKAQQASLNHGMWFHRPFRIDEWLLYAQHVPSSAGGRAIARGSVFTRDGALVASVVQEGLSQVAPGDSALGGR
jgi:acyl-CoA thioesterase II